MQASSWHRLAIVVGVAAVVAACASPTDGGPNLNRCNYLPGGLSLNGCVIVTGRVLDSAGAPIPDAMAGPSWLSPDGQSYYAGMYDTDDEGRFRFALRRYSGAVSDSGFHWIRGQVLPMGCFKDIRFLDSMPVRYRLRPADNPDTIYVEIRLPLERYVPPGICYRS